MTRHFLKLTDLSVGEANVIIERGIELKRLQREKTPHLTCPNATLAMIFERNSTRTRVAFETGMAQLGGSALFLSNVDTQLGRGEPIEDTSRVLSKMVDIVMIRAQKQATIDRFARFADIPVINGMSDELHPCQALADIMTYVEKHGSIQGKQVAFIGDGHNMCHSFMEASYLFDFQLKVVTPPCYQPRSDYVERFGKNVIFVDSAVDAATNADLLATDVWTSMGQEQERERLSAFKELQVTKSLLDEANSDVMFLHCLPAHRGEEVDEFVLDDPRSAVWEEAGNRLHAQKALLEFLLH